MLLLPPELAADFLLCPADDPPLFELMLLRPDGEPNEDDKLPELCVR